MVRRAARSRSDETRFHLRDRSLHQSRAQKRTLPARAPLAGGHPAQSLQNGDFGRRPSPSRPDGGKDFRRTDQRRPVRGLAGDMPRPHTLARGDRRRGQSPRPQGAAGRATHQGGGRGVAVSPSLQSRYEPHRKSLLQAQSLPAQTRRTDRRGSDPRPRNLRRNLQALRMYKLLQILWLSGRYRMIGFCSSPIPSNLFLHYTFDLWMNRTHPDLPWRRYADDGLVHCRTEQEAEALRAELRARLAECHLELHPTKTKIVYCRDGKRKGTYPNVKFDFLGYCFRPRWFKKSRDNSMFCGFNPAVSPSALKTMRSTIRDLNIRRQTQLSLADIARTLNPLVRGWIEYYGRYAPSALSPMLRYVNQTLVRWAMRKFKRFKAHKIRASRFLQKLVRERMSLFVHWRIGMTGTFA